MSQAWECSQSRGNTLLVLLAICDCANDEGLAWPSVATLAKKARIDRTTVMRHVGELEALHELRVLRTHGASNRYVVTLANQSQGATSPELRLVADCDPTSRSGATTTSRSGATRTISRTVKKRQREIPRTFPPGFTLSEADRAFAAKKGIGDIDEEFEAFRDWHIGKGTVWANWHAVWRTWCRKGKRFADEKANGRALPAGPKYRDLSGY